MADRQLSRGDTGSDVELAQDLLNRGGALLDEDGGFGAGTAAAVRVCQARGGLTMSGVVDDPTWALLRGMPEPCPGIATAAVNFIAQQEISNRAYYDAVVTQPDWPGEQSGITIGVGYDLAMETTFEADWGNLLPATTLDALRPCVGQRGTTAMAGALAGHSIPWDAAWQVFLKRSLQKSLSETRETFPGFDDLPPLCRGALVSLVYNRGPAMIDDSRNDPRREMRQIRRAVETQNAAAVPDLLRAMNRLWPDSRGLRDRRDAEAKLFEEGLAEAGK
jgi:hypothetical protein